MSWNIFRYLADISHLLAKCILIWAIHANSSAEGVSLLMQLFYLIVFLTRYLPQAWIPKGYSPAFIVWNFSFKLFFILSSLYTIALMTKFYARTREREVASKAGWWSFGIVLVLSPFVMLIFDPKGTWDAREWLWVFSIMLESVAVIPQLLLLRQTQVPTVLDSFYLMMLGSYRFFYLLNWLVRGFTEYRWDNDRQMEVHRWDPISITFGIIQTLFYLDFAWVYWSRQRVKLRGGALVDSDDFHRGWLVRALLGQRGARNQDLDSDDEEAQPEAHRDGHASPQPQRKANKWGPRGISVSADDGVFEAESGGLAHPDAFEDQDSDDEPSRLPAKAADSATSHDTNNKS